MVRRDMVVFAGLCFAFAAGVCVGKFDTQTELRSITDPWAIVIILSIIGLFAFVGTRRLSRQSKTKRFPSGGVL
jgi:hypothetical protein